jgi:hypothetical protein
MRGEKRMKKIFFFCLFISGLILVPFADAKTRKTTVHSVKPVKSYAMVISKIDYECSVDIDRDGHKEKVSIIERVRTGIVQLWITDRFGIVTMIDLDLPKVDLVIHRVEYEDILGIGTDQIFLTTSHGFHGKADVSEKMLTIIAVSKDGNSFKHDKIFRQKLEFYGKDTISKAGEHKVWKVLLVHARPPKIVTMKTRDVQFPAKE